MPSNCQSKRNVPCFLQTLSDNFCTIFCGQVRKTNNPAAIGVAVVHNKLKEKKAQLPDDVAYFAGEEVPDKWNCYPWDAAAYGTLHSRKEKDCKEKNRTKQNRTEQNRRSFAIVGVVSYHGWHCA